MAAQGMQPVSAQNLAAAIGVERSGGIGGQPVSVDNLKAALAAVGGGAACLYDGEPALTVTLSGDPDDYGLILVLTRYMNNSTPVINAYPYPPELTHFTGPDTGYQLRGSSFFGTNGGQYANSTVSFFIDGLTITPNYKYGDMKIVRVFGINYD